MLSCIYSVLYGLLNSPVLDVFHLHIDHHSVVLHVDHHVSSFSLSALFMVHYYIKYRIIRDSLYKTLV